MIFRFFSDLILIQRLKEVQVCEVPAPGYSIRSRFGPLTLDPGVCLCLVIDWINSDESYPQVCLYYRVTQGRKRAMSC